MITVADFNVIMTPKIGRNKYIKNVYVQREL